MDERLPLCWCKKKPNKTRWNWGKMHFNNKISPQLTFLHYKCTSEVQQPGTENFVPNYINLATFGLEIVYIYRTFYIACNQVHYYAFPYSITQYCISHLVFKLTIISPWYTRTGRRSPYILYRGKWNKNKISSWGNPLGGTDTPDLPLHGRLWLELGFLIII